MAALYAMRIVLQVLFYALHVFFYVVLFGYEME